MLITDSCTVQFQDREDFGRFCMALREDRVPYSLGGFLTIFLSQTRNFEELPNKCQALLREFTEKGYKIRKRYFVSRHDSRKLVTREEAEKRLREATQRLRDRTQQSK